MVVRRSGIGNPYDTFGQPRPGASAFRFVKRDVGKGHRGKDVRGDCTVRALTLAAGIRYEAAWDLLYQAQGRHRFTGVALQQLLDLEPVMFGVMPACLFPRSVVSPE